MNMFWVFLGGGVGSLLRFGVTELTKKFWNGVFPLPTLLVNIFACATLGVLFTIMKDRIQQSDWLFYLLIVGLCGGFSTFSAFANETLDLFRKGMMVYGVLNILISVSLCIFLIATIKK